MSKLDDLIEKYASDLEEKCGLEPDRDLLTKIATALGPSIYDRDASVVAAGSTAELQTLQSSIVTRFGLEDDPAMGAIQKAIRAYGRSDSHKYRAVLVYLIAKDLGKESAFA